VGGPEDVADLLARGADLVQAGTVFLRCPESGAPAALKDALATSAASGTTGITRAFSGRRARALVNAMVREHPGAPAAYPEINNATRPLRARAARAGDPEHMSLYAGTAFGRAEAEPVATIIERLVSRVRR
jgi:nitronate monooxygenase